MTAPPPAIPPGTREVLAILWATDGHPPEPVDDAERWLMADAGEMAAIRTERDRLLRVIARFPARRRSGAGR